MCSIIRQSTLAIVLACCCLHALSQSNRCDSIHWNFDVNQFAIDGDKLMADFADKGWTLEFFQSNEIDVTIYGATDCPGSYVYNTKLAGNRALYLRNYFEVSSFPKLTIVDSYAIPERNCTRPGQGYNRTDRVTALKVCWAGENATVVAQNNTQDVKEGAVKVNAETVAGEVVQQTNTNETTVEKEGGTTKVSNTKQVNNATAEAKATDTQAAAEAVKTAAGDSLQTHPKGIAETVAVNEVAADSASRVVSETKAISKQLKTDSMNVWLTDSTYTRPVKPKKVFDLASAIELNKGDELIMDGLNFYPGSHRTLPEAKPILRKLLQALNENPTLMIEIQGHVCCASKPNEDGLDDETGDFKLSWNRAQYIRDYLIQNGIAQERISYRGFAMTRPLVYPEKTIQDQIKNRRVEILVTAE
jgi:outer membrane protein OmpA-like peptidoglycan-associated protein